MTSTAPTDAPDPVFSNRITFEADVSAAVHVDRVVASVPEPSAWLQLVAGAGGLSLLYRRRGRSAAEIIGI
jgi:hypothetical protein